VVRLEKMHSLLKSRNIIQRVLFRSDTCNGKSDFFANHLIRDLDLHGSWKENENGLKDFLFKNENYKEFNSLENKVLKMLYQKIASSKDDGLLKSDTDEDSGIVKMTFTSNSEDLAINFVTILYEELSKFYITKATEKPTQTVKLTTEKTDSIRNLLDTYQYQLLKLQDRNRNISLRQYEVDRVKLETRIQTLILAYGEALKNKEIADFNLKSTTPYFQTLDEPISPINPSSGSLIGNGILGILLGIFVGAAYLIIRKLFRDIMDEKNV